MPEIKKKKRQAPVKGGKLSSRKIAGYDTMLTDVVELLEIARRGAARSVNAIMTATYWEIGKRIVEKEQKGKTRAGYGEALIEKLSHDLTVRFTRGFSQRNLEQMRRFYLKWQIPQTMSAEFDDNDEQIPQTVSAQFDSLTDLAKHFPLPWSAYVRLLSVRSPDARGFYETEALRDGWTVRQLERQIDSQFYERTALSRSKAAMLTKGAKPKPEDRISPEEEVKDPYVLEFLGLKDEYSENELEEALIRHLEAFLLELGGDFAFVGRQKRLRIDDEWYRVDLLFYHRRLRCLVIIDLKLGKFIPGDAGQMHLYLNYAREHWTLPDENPPVGLILCAEKGKDVVRYALEGLSNKVLAAEYKTVLPDTKTIKAELQKTRKLFKECKK